MQAIIIASDPKARQDLKVPAFEFVNNLRNEPTAWLPCLGLFTHLPRHADIVRVFSLEIVNSAIRAGIVDQQGLAVVKQSLVEYLAKEYTARQTGTATVNAPDSWTIENKIAQTITYLFCNLYDSHWTSFFDDLLSLTTSPSGQRDNLIGVAFYLRVIESIHDEIGDVLQARSKEEQERANVLKDLVRARDVAKIAASWQEILSHWQLSNGTVGELTLKCVAKWVSWIDISLVVNPQMLQLISLQVEQKSIEGIPHAEQRARDCALDALTEIVSKKMSSTDKLDMINFIGVQNIVEKLCAWPILSNSQKSDYDVDLAEIVAKLVNAVVADVVRALESEQQSSTTWSKAEKMLEAFLPHLLRFFSDSYDDVCTHVIQAMSDVLSYFRRAFQGDEFVSMRASFLLPILLAIFNKSKIDDIVDEWGEFYNDDDEAEAEFMELRKRLTNLQSSIAATDEQLYIDAVSQLVNNTFESLDSEGPRLNWRVLELALHEMYQLGDLAIKSGGLYQKNKPNSPPAERLIRMMLLMVQSQVGTFPNPEIQIQYMEICVRFSSFFEKNTEYIQRVLQNFLLHAHSSQTRVRLRAWYLLQRFVRQQRHNVGPVADVIVPNLQDLLSINAVVPNQNDDADSEDEEADSTFTAQLYLFETIGCIISTSNVPAEKQMQYAQIVMQPLFTDIQNNLNAAKSSKQASLQVHHNIMAFGNVARGYFDWSGASTMQAAENIPSTIKEAFGQVAEATLIALETLKEHFDIRQAARFTFTRLLGMVGRQMLQQLPRWVDGLLSASASRDEMAQLLRLLDQVTFGFKEEVSSFLDAVFGSLLQKVYAGVSAPATGTDDEVELAELKREYLNFLLVVLGNGLGGSVLVSTTNQPHFETVIESIEHFTKDVSDFVTAKMAFQLLSRMCLVWGGPDVVAGQISSDINQAQQQELPGFKEFMMTRFSPLCWSMPANPNFNPKDGQARQVLMEAAALQKTIFAKNGEAYITYLRNTELPNVGLQGGPMMEDFFSKLATMDVKSWRSWFAKFVSSGGAV